LVGFPDMFDISVAAFLLSLLCWKGRVYICTYHGHKIERVANTDGFHSIFSLGN